MAFDPKKIQRGRVPLPPRLCWYSADGVGKTTSAAGAPEPFFFDFNRGSIKFDVHRFSPADYDEFLEWLTALELGKIPCKTVVIDSLTELESMFTKKLFGDRGPNSGEWQYGRGDDYSYAKWRELLAQLERIWLQGRGIILTAHAKVMKFNDPTGPAYDRFVLSLRAGAAEVVRQWCDYVCFAREEIVLDQSKTERTKGKTTGVVYQYTRRCPAYDAKARGSTLFPARLPLGWQPLIEAIEADESRSVSMRKEIDTMLVELGVPETTRTVMEWLRGHPMTVVETHNRVKELLDAKQASVETGAVANATPETQTQATAVS